MESKRGRPTAAESAARNTRIAAVVAHLLRNDGFDALTFDRVAAEARVAKRTLYRDYRDRGGLVRAAVRRLHDAAQEQARPTPAHAPDATAQHAPPSEHARSQQAPSDHAAPEDPPPVSAPLREYAIALVATLLSDEAIGVHRAVVAAALQYPEVAAAFYAEGPQRSMRELEPLLAAASAPHQTRGPSAEIAFSALTGELHRQRLLGLAPAPDATAVAQHVDAVLAAWRIG